MGTVRFRHCGPVTEGAFSADGEVLATSCAGFELYLWEIKTGRLIRSSCPDDLGPFALSSDGPVLVDPDDHTVRLLDAATGKILRQYELADVDSLWRSIQASHGRWMVGQAFNSSGVMVHEAESGKHRSMPAGFAEDTWQYALSPDGTTLAACQVDEHRMTLTLWEMTTGARRCRLATGETICFDLVFSPDGKTLATLQRDGRIRLWSTVTGKEVRAVGTHHRAKGIAFDPSGTLLATWGEDTTILLWDVAACTRRNDFVELPKISTAEAWARLGDRRADVAYRAMWQLASEPKESVSFLAQRVQAVTSPPAEQVARWITELDSNDFARRERATSKLEACCHAIVQSLQAAIETAPSAEARQRLKRLLETARVRKMGFPSGDALRALRAIESLEHMGTGEAQRVLEKLAAGARGARLTEDAAAALARLRRNVSR